jgi:hypothetical protein
MARTSPDPGSGTARDPDILTAEELAARLHVDVQTVRDLSAAEDEAAAAEDGDGAARDAKAVVLGGTRVGRRLYSWSAIYVQLAGQGVPDGEICSPAELARRLGVPKRTVQRGLAPPGTPGKLPGRKVGGQWRSAWPAVHLQIRSPAPAGQAGSPAAR